MHNRHFPVLYFLHASFWLSWVICVGLPHVFDSELKLNLEGIKSPQLVSKFSTSLVQKCDFTHTCQQVSALRSNAQMAASTPYGRSESGHFLLSVHENKLTWSFSTLTVIKRYQSQKSKHALPPGEEKTKQFKRKGRVCFLYRLSVRSIKVDNCTTSIRWVALGRRSPEVSQRCTCMLSSPNWRWIIYNSDGHVPAQVMPAPCALSTCCTNLIAATLNPLIGSWLSICVDKVGQFFFFLTGHESQFKE